MTKSLPHYIIVSETNIKLNHKIMPHIVYISASQPTGRDPVTGRGDFQMGRGDFQMGRGLSSK